jgi:Na+/proline symporter
MDGHIWLALIMVLYFAILVWIARMTSKDQSNESFFIGKRNSHWYVVAFGMIGTSLSGVTFISVPGTVGSQGFYYFQVVMGYFLGYLVVAFVLLPIYYSLKLTSIYNYLETRLGNIAYKTGSSFFILSRTIWATARLYLVINVLQLFLLDELGVSFHMTAIFILGMILVYTLQGGVKTIVWTDTLQTFFMLSGLIICIIMILQHLNISFGESLVLMDQKNYLRVFNTDLFSGSHFLKHIIGGALITISMTGMDQEMMQKNISVKTLKDSQKNMIVFSIILIVVNALFLLLGGLLYLFASQNNIQVVGDDLFPAISMNYMPQLFSLVFIIALISALFPSADGAITALTSSFCIDILGFNKNHKLSEEQKIKLRKKVHYLFALVFLILIFIFKVIDNKSIIDLILKLAGYTYGPLLGLFSFAILTKRILPDTHKITTVCIMVPFLVFILDWQAANWFQGFSFGFLNLGINGLLTFAGLYVISNKHT